MESCPWIYQNSVAILMSALAGFHGTTNICISTQVQMLWAAASTYIFQERWRHNSRRVQGWNYLSAYDFQIQMSVSGLIVNFFDSQPLLSHFRAEYMHPCYIARCWDLWRRAHGDSSMAGGGGYTSTSSSLLEPVACEYRCYYCKNRCTRGHKAGHKHHTCHEHRTCRHWCLDDEPIQDHGLQSHPAVVHWDAKCCIDVTCWFAKRSSVWGDLLIHCRIFLFCHLHWFCGRKKSSS